MYDTLNIFKANLIQGLSRQTDTKIMVSCTFDAERGEMAKFQPSCAWRFWTCLNPAFRGKLGGYEPKETETKEPSEAKALGFVQPNVNERED